MNGAARVEAPAELDAYKPLVSAALAQYALDRPAALFVRHNENLTFRVTDAMARSWLLRLHLPVRSNFPPEFRRVEAIESELLWLEALSSESDVVVQRPMRNRDRRMVTMVSRADGRQVPCTLLGWIDGRTFDTKAPDAEALAGQLGFLTARLHLHSRTWEQPEGFTRPALDEASVTRAMRRLHIAVDAAFISQAEYAVYEKAAERIAQVMRGLGQGRGEWGLIHADLGAGNILVRGNDLSPIDFSLSCFAHFLFDVGGCASGLDERLRLTFLAGYQRMFPLAPEAIRAADAFALLSVINCFGFLLPDPKRYEWLKRRIPEVARTYCPMLLRGEPFILP